MRGETYQRTTRGRKTFLASIVVAGLVAGCTADATQPAPAVETITRLSEGPITVDLRDAERVWVFDPSEGDLPIDDVTLICPNGAFMPLRHWLWEQEELLGFDLGTEQRTLFSLGPTEEITAAPLAQQAGDCVEDCHQCPDGAWICHDTCTGASGDEPRTRTGDGNIDGPLDPPHSGSGSSTDPPGDDSGGGTPEPYDPRDPAPPMY